MPSFTLQEIALYLALVNLLTYFLYWRDKRAAARGNRRTPEGTLLMLVLLGGSPAAFVASRRFRHKTKKGSFRFKFWVVVTVQLVAAYYYFVLA